MKFITLFRHAKSSWKYPVIDLYRPLNGRGIRQAQEMANKCRLEAPDLILCSNAVRAASTALIYADKLCFDMQKFRCVTQLYELDSMGLVKYLSENLTEHTNRLWLFGHNPTLNDFCAQMVSTELDNIVTAGYVDLALDIGHWKDLIHCKARLLEANNR